MTRFSLASFFDPQSVVVIDAPRDPSKVGLSGRQ